MATKIKVEVSKTVQERQYEPIVFRYSLERMTDADTNVEISDEIQDMSEFLQKEIETSLTNRGVE